MPDNKKPPDNSIPPPPMDPFPTYQTPYPRSNKDDENPFILFRRFADEQFSSFFSGFPHLFGLSSSGSDRWKKEVDDLMRQRQEWEEGFRKQVEQEMEEMRQQLEKSKNEAWKSMEDAWKQHSKENRSDVNDTPWWTRGAAARCPALNGQEPQKNADKCPALYDEAGQPRTELDAYNALPKENDKYAQVFQAPADEPTEKKPFSSWFSALGWDGKQKEKCSTNNSKNSKNSKNPATEDRALLDDKPMSPPTIYSFWAARRMQPFENPEETIPWLMLSPYSPIYLCNPAQSRLFKVKVQDSEGVPFQISGAKFFERLYTDVDEKMARQKPWADAFEDLLSLQQTGKMVDRDNWNTWRTPKTWIHDMVSRGSLGNKWGFNEQGMLVKRATDPKTATTSESLLTREDRCARWRQNRHCRRNKYAQDATASEKQSEEKDRIADKALAPFPDVSGFLLAAADPTAADDDEVTQDEYEAATMEGSSALKPVDERESTTPLYSTLPSSSYSTSSSLSPSTSNDAKNDANKSVVSTLTTLLTRTLPDGSIESKLVLKRRFADGSEETDESFGVINLPDPNTSTKTEDKETQTQLQSEPALMSKSEDAGQQVPFDMYRDQLRSLDEQQTKEEEYKREQEQESKVSKVPKRFPRRIPISTGEPEAESEHEQQQIATPPPPPPQQDKSNNNDRPRRSGSGWFWN